MEMVANEMIEKTKVKPGESVESAIQKISLAQSFMDFLRELFSWVFEKLKTAIKWCWQQAKDFFGYLKIVFCLASVMYMVDCTIRSSSAITVLRMKLILG